MARDVDIYKRDIDENYAKACKGHSRKGKVKAELKH